MSKAKKITVAVVACLFALFGIFVIFWYFGDSYGEFYSKAIKGFKIPGLDTSFTPQGLCYNEYEKTFFVSGYMSDGSASRIYVVDAQTQQTVKYITLLTTDGKDYVDHAGGITANENYVWVVGDGILNRILLWEINSAQNGDKVNIIDSMETGNGADFVTIDKVQNILWVGEFHRDKAYETDESHYFETSSGTNKALSFGYEMSDNAEQGSLGFSTLTPVIALSTPSLVQGMIIAGEKIVLSTSYSLPDSHLYTYTNILELPTDKTYSVSQDISIPLYILDEENLLGDMSAPCMSEEIEYVNGRVFVLFESACQKYSAVTREQIRNVYSYAI